MALRFDSCGHFRSAFDTHRKCLSCRKAEGGPVCVRGSCCEVCESWSPDLWDKMEASLAKSQSKREKRRKDKERARQATATVTSPSSVAGADDSLELHPESDEWESSESGTGPSQREVGKRSAL